MIEGRVLDMPDLNESRSGALVAVYRHLGKHVKAGLGYNFTNFSEDLTDMSFKSHGIFMNGMLGLDTDNFTFARNCVEWLSEKGKRKYALLIEEGRVMTVPSPATADRFVMTRVGNLAHDQRRDVGE